MNFFFLILSDSLCHRGNILMFIWFPCSSSSLLLWDCLQMFGQKRLVKNQFILVWFGHADRFFQKQNQRNLVNIRYKMAQFNKKISPVLKKSYQNSIKCFSFSSSIAYFFGKMKSYFSFSSAKESFLCDWNGIKIIIKTWPRHIRHIK